MKAIKPVKHLDISAYGSENLLVGDINNDRVAEFILSQGPGSVGVEAFKPGRAEGWRKGHVTEEDLALDCLTVVDLYGDILWQRGNPWQRPYPFRTHGGANAMIVADVDGDGRNEFLRIHGDKLEMIEGDTGHLIRSVELDSESYYQVLTASFTEDGRKHVVVKPIGIGLPGHPHGCPVNVFDPEWISCWGPCDFKGVGHKPIAFDVDADGRDELLIGWELVGPDGAVRWTLPLEGDAAFSHEDRRVLADIDEDGELEQVLAMERLGLVVTDLNGCIKWREPSGHCGDACVGKFFGDRPGLQIMYNDEEAGQKGEKGASVMADGRRGKIIWDHTVDMYGQAIDWPNELGPQAILAVPHEYYNDPEDARPFIMDGNRKVLATFDIPKRLPSRNDFDLPHTNKWRGDWGDYYVHKCVSLDDTGPCIVVSSRTDLWIFDICGSALSS